MARIGGCYDSWEIDPEPYYAAMKKARRLVAMNKKQILETMKKTGGSVLIQQRGKPTAHFAHPSAVPEDDVLARGDPEAERLTAEQLEAHAQQLLARAQALRPPAANPTPVLDTGKEPAVAVPQGDRARETTPEATAHPEDADDAQDAQSRATRSRKGR
jgi:multidrug resistance efflux pump